MDQLTLFGFISVATMVVAYTLERRGRYWILIFSCACLASALYGLLAGTWPFAVAESVWALVAFVRWRQARQP
jgi:hypothetical protein